uniref:Major facilitator superfamily (MFS) profile domain-containing protein n=1 Tax=Oryza meridionalis TaxID=40149 RepID=A0A0E0F4Q8_9ORYZ
MGSSSGLVDWRGRPVDTRKHGGVRASIYIHMLVWLSNVSNIGNMTNIVSYLSVKMNMGVAAASTTSASFVAMMQVFTIPAAFLADSYLKRVYTVLLFAPIEILGYILLAIQAHVPSLHPAPCELAGAAATIQPAPGTCEAVHGSNLSLLMLGLYLICVGEGAVRACLPALGGDQFDEGDAAEQRQAASFFNWYAFAVSLGALVGLVAVVWVQDNKGWDAGFAVCGAVVLLGLLAWAAGMTTYRNKLPAGSPITRILQVLVVAFKKRNLQLPENPDELYQPNNDDSAKGLEILQRTRGLKCLDKAAIVCGGGSNGGAWSVCSVSQVEETKIVLRMVPIFLTAALGYMPVSVVLTFTVQQGNIMDTRMGAIRVSPATLFVIPTVFQLAILVVYDRAVVPALRRATGRVGGVTHLQRIGVGFVSSLASCAVAAAVEARRRSLASSSSAMSVFWLTPQFFLLGVVDVTSFVGLLEFFSSEASDGMKSIGSSIFYCMLGMAAWLNTMLIELVNRVTRWRHGGGGGWLDGANLNESRLDLFYWLVSGIELVAFMAYLLFAWRYVYRNDQRIAAAADAVDEQEDKKAPSNGSLVQINLI